MPAAYLQHWVTRLLAAGLLLALASGLVACGGSSAPEAPVPWVGDCDPDFADATARVLDAVRLVHGPGVEYHPSQPRAMAFYIGNDEWVSTAWGHFDGVPISLYQHDSTAARWQLVIASAIPPTLIGRDAQTGLALLQADGTGVPPLRVAGTAPQVGDRLRLVGYSFRFDPQPRGHVLWPARCAAAPSAEASASPGVPPPPGRIASDAPREPTHIVPHVFAGTVQELLTVDGRQYFHHDALPEGHRYSDTDSIFEGGPLFTPGGAVIGVHGRGIWRADAREEYNRMDVTSFDVIGPMLPALLARLRAGSGEPPVVRPTLHAFCPWAREDAAHPATCKAGALAGVRAWERASRWTFWLSGPALRDWIGYRITDSEGRDTRPTRLQVQPYSQISDLSSQLQRERLRPGTYEIAVRDILGLWSGGDDDLGWSNRVTFRLLPADPAPPD